MTRDTRALQQRRHASIRAHILGIVLMGGVLPLALVGFWLTSTAVRSGEDLLRNQLDSSLANIERSIATKWEFRQSDLLWLARNENARHALESGVVSPADSAYFSRAREALAATIASFTYRDSSGGELYSSARMDSVRRSSRVDPEQPGDAAGVARRTMFATYTVRALSAVVGTVDAEVFLDAVAPFDSARLLLPGSALAIRDTLRGVVLLRFRQDVEFPSSAAPLSVDGAPWMLRTVRIVDPPWELAVAAPIAPYVTPFEQAGRVGLAAVILVVLLAVVLSGFLTARLVRSIGGLVSAANSVAGGNLTRQADEVGPTEFRLLAASFNSMTESLRRMVGELAQRRALAAVGEFAASLSHEVRNALTSVQVGLERVDERSEDEKNRAILGRTLAHVRRLDAVVTGSLRVARGGTVVPQPINVAELVRDAVQAAEPSFVTAGARLVAHEVDDMLTTSGDRDSLHQLFLNLLLNAQEALPAGGEASVAVEANNGTIRVSISDCGGGMTSEQIGHAFEPYYTTRTKGTGLGLPIARQIALAHGGDLAIESTPGEGTVVTVRLPVATIGV